MTESKRRKIHERAKVNPRMTRRGNKRELFLQAHYPERSRRKTKKRRENDVSCPGLSSIKYRAYLMEDGERRERERGRRERRSKKRARKGKRASRSHHYVM
jgi:hypothetical protein